MSPNNVAKNSFKWSFFIQLTFQLFGFIVSIFLARILSPSDFGIIGILTIFINLSKKITDGGLAASLIRTKDVSDRDFSTVFYFNLFISLTIYLIVFILSPYIAAFFEVALIEDLLKVYGLAIIISTFTITQSVKLNKDLNFKAQFKILLPSLLLSGIMGILAAYNGFGVWSLVIKEIAFAVISSIQLWFYSKWKPLLLFDKKLFKIHFNFGYKLTITELLSQFFNDSYRAVIGKYFSVSQLGYFSRAKSMEEFPSGVIFNTVNRVMFPMMSNMQDDDNRLREVFSQIIKIINFVVTPFLMLIVLVAEPLFVFLLTDKWLPAVPYFRILVLGGIISPLFPYLMNICKVKGQSGLILKLNLVEYVFISCSILAVIPFGMYGLLWGLVLATLAKLIVAMFFAGALIKYSVKHQLYDLKDGFLIAFLCYTIVSVLVQVDFFQSLSPLIYLMLVPAIFYSFLLVFSTVLRIESFQLVKTIIFKK